MNEAFNMKCRKYRNVGLEKEVIPIVINPWYEMHPKSLELLKPYINTPAMLRMLAFEVSTQSVMRK